MNDRLRTVMIQRKATPEDLAAFCEVDVKPAGRESRRRPGSVLESTQEHIDVLVFSGTFLARTDPRVAAMLAERADAGVRVRLCFGGPSGKGWSSETRKNGVGGTLSTKIRASLICYRKLIGTLG